MKGGEEERWGGGGGGGRGNVTREEITCSLVTDSRSSPEGEPITLSIMCTWSRSAEEVIKEATKNIETERSQ